MGTLARYDGAFETLSLRGYWDYGDDYQRIARLPVGESSVRT